jgi:oligoribonuclease NrnB/cAMP/cGMP phosphodiesterase (DHH superfamily)
MNKVLVLYHSDADGFASAYALWTHYRDEATYVPVQYGQPVPEIPEGIEHIYIVDFSYRREICEELAEKYVLTIIDHHQTAEKDLVGLPYALFDQCYSGCVLTWAYLEESKPPLILQYVQDRDLWKFELPHSEEVNLFIAALPFDFMVWDDYANDDDFFFCAYAAGSAIKSFRDQQIKSVLKNTRKMLLADFLVPVVNCSNNISEVGHALNEAHPEAPFSVSYCDRKDLRSWSLRSVGEFDVSAVAKLFGGGGHKHAAGFTTDVTWIEVPDPAFEKAFKDASRIQALP